MALYRVKARWTGFSGAPGYSIFHFNDSVDSATYTPDTAAAAVRKFFFDQQSLLPSAVSINVDTAVDVINPADGKMVDIQNATATPTVTGTQTGTFAAVAGALVHWNTSGVRNGRRVRGKTFMVPLGTVIYQSDGTLNPGSMTTIQTAADNLINDSASALVCYARPSDTLGPGQQYLVTSARVPDKAVIMRSRRD